MLNDDGWKTIIQLGKLERLVVDSTRITGLQGLLRELYLNDTKITDAGLLLLTGLSHLQAVNVGGTGVSETGVNLLRIALPSCSVRN